MPHAGKALYSNFSFIYLDFFKLLMIFLTSLGDL